MSSEPEFEKMTRHQKLAVFLVIIGPHSAAEVLRHFDDTEIELVCREMALFTMVSDSLRQKALEEFTPVIGQSLVATLGGLDYARRTLELVRGDASAGNIMGRLGPAGSEMEIIKEISEMEGRQIYGLIKHEQAQTISFVLSYLDAPKAAEIFAMLASELREEVVERLGTIESTSLDLVGKIVRSLSKHFDSKGQPNYHRSGGASAVAELLKGLDKETSKSLLARLEERNAQLGAAIRKKMFNFEDLGRLTPEDLQRVLREVESSSLATSMKSATEGLKEKIYGAISKRAAESLRDEIGMLGAVRLKEVEIAQDAIIQVVRRLEEEGTVSFESGGDAALVS